MVMCCTKELCHRSMFQFVFADGFRTNWKLHARSKQGYSHRGKGGEGGVILHNVLVMLVLHL